jgi:phosphatidylinositol kinase/protein kinase (PI-3  family)
MPVEDAERYGVLKDTLGNLCNAIEVRTEFLLVNDISTKKDELIKTVNNSVVDVERALKEIQRENLTAIEDMKEDLEDAMLSLGLLDSQENKIREIVKSCTVKTKQIFDKANGINLQFERILSILNHRPNM